MKINMGYLITYFPECTDRNIQPLMPVDASGIKKREAAVSGRSAISLRENRSIRRIKNHGALAGLYGPRQQAFLPYVVRDDHMTRESAGDFFHALKKTEGQRIGAGAE